MGRTTMLNRFTIVIALAISTACIEYYAADAFAASPIFESTATKPNAAKPFTPWRVCVPKHASNSCLPLSLSRETISSNKTAATPSAVDPTRPDSDLVPKRSNHAENSTKDKFFIRPALLVDMNRASKILADAFFKGPQTNWITYQYEKFVTYLSLEANFPRSPWQRSRYEIFVACDADSGTVVGMVEIDARGMTDERTSRVYEQSGGSAYMCNLAVDEKQRRKGIATSLVDECERQVRNWYAEDQRKEQRNSDSDSNTNIESNLKNDVIYYTKNDIINDIFGNENGNRMTKTMNNKMSQSVCLKVRESDEAAVQMYTKLGYSTVSQEVAENANKMRGNILLMKKSLS